MRKIISLFFATLLFIGCSETPKSSTVRTAEELDKDIKTMLNEAEAAEIEIQNSDSENVKEEEPEEILTDKELEAKTEEVELKVLSKVTFCDCIKKQKVLDNQLMETEDDAEMDKIMAEMDALSEGECKNLMADKSTSPEDREARKAKIQGCLGK
ncbi:MAG: hypothetical protein JKY53_02295 [Flavobacteriales bacterium]|nr:hypothetical protein [Flavobacteriales bacterium]